MRRIVIALAALSLLSSCGGGGGSNDNPPPPKGGVTVTLTPVVSGFNNPLDVEVPNDNTRRTFIVEQGGKIFILQNTGAVLSTPFLDISSKITSGGETGLLGLAFHPNYSSNGLFYLNYTRTIGGGLQTVIAEYKVSAVNPNLADTNSERILITQNQPFNNHNGGQLAFGADGFLYIGLGDGGSGGDPLNNAQNKQVLLGKMLRIDVDHTSTGKPYAIPADNPFASGSNGLPEIFAIGFRNPWRFSFDSASKRLFVADVGENSFEEVDVVTNGGNYGWNIMEGSHCFNPSTGCNMTGLTLPITDYPRSDGSTVIGGFVYHGSALPNLQGGYVFGDFGSGKIWVLKEGPTNTWTRSDVLATGKSISSFGVDPNGELYVVDYSGALLRLSPL